MEIIKQLDLNTLANYCKTSKFINDVCKRNKEYISKHFVKKYSIDINFVNDFYGVIFKDYASTLRMYLNMRKDINYHAWEYLVNDTSYHKSIQDLARSFRHYILGQNTNGKITPELLQTMWFVDWANTLYIEALEEEYLDYIKNFKPIHNIFYKALPRV